MSSGSKKVTVGYWYRMLFGYGWCKGPIDAFLELRGGGRTAWKGVVTQTSRIYVDAENLWGGKKREGGLQGYFDVQLGESDQVVNDYLRARLGADQPTYRGKAIGVWRGGRYGAMNPYPKPMEFKLRRILRGWDNDECWYPEKAEITSMDAPPDFTLTWTRTTNSPHTFTSPSQVSGWSHNPNDYSTEAAGWHISWPTGNGATGIAWLHISAPGGVNREFHLDVKVNYDDSGKVIGVKGVTIGGATAPPVVQGYPRSEGVRVIVPAHSGAFAGYVAFACVDARDIETGAGLGSPSNHRMQVSSTTVISTLSAMNPAHILYDSITAADMQGEPVGMLNEESFVAAADQLFSEGFGLCTTYDPDAETVEEFQQRICNVIGGSLTQSRINGQYYLDLIRDDDTGSIPIITADDILELKWEPVPLTEVINQITVEWFDPERKEHRSTPPIQSLGAIQAAGRVIPEVMRYPEIPSESLALRVAGRDLQARSTPLTRFTLTLNRRHGIWALRPGKRFRLQSPQDGFADVVCILGDIDTGTLTSGRITIKAVQDVFGMPDTVYVEAEGGQAPPQNLPPAASPHQRLIEAPYVELVANMSGAELTEFPGDAGAMMAMASRPISGLNYSIWSAAEGAELEDNGSGDWCPVARVVEEADYLDTDFTLTSGSNLGDVAVGDWALWDEEIIRIDAIDPELNLLTVGRGCADTVPHKHAANSLIYFCGDWGATDDVQYVDGETVTVKLLTRTSSAELSIENAKELGVKMRQRQLRPYPPAGVKINSQDYPEQIFGDIVLRWAHRDRPMQADKLIDVRAPSVGPEPGTSYVAELYSASGNVPLLVESDITGDTTASLTPPGEGSYRVELYSSRDGLPSWQRYSYIVRVGDGPEPDPHWDNVVSLLHLDGDLMDETGRVWGVIGKPSFEHVEPIYGTGSFKTNGNDAAETANHELINNNNDPYCVEFTFKAVSLSTFGTHNPLFWSYSNGPYGDSLIGIKSSTGLFVQLHSGSHSWIITENLAPITIGVKYHLAITYDGSDLRVFLDGVLVYVGVGIKIQTPTRPLRFGTAAEGRYMQGSNHIYDELRITKGVARYTENFTPPTEPFPNFGP